LNKSKS